MSVSLKRLSWNGDNLERRLRKAALAAIDDTTAAAALYARQNHPGWHNRTGTAEGSIRMEPARDVGGRQYRGLFGSFDVDYFIWLEIGARGRPGDYTLRRAADAEFPHVLRRFRAHYGR